MKASVFVGTSLDGFVARLDGAFDFLQAGGGEPRGYDEFLATVDALIIGRHTYETVLSLGEWPYGDNLTVVLSTHPLAPAPVGAVLEMSGLPTEIASQLTRRGTRHFLCGWWDHDSALSRSPADTANHDHARGIATQQYAGGLVKSEYEVAD